MDQTGIWKLFFATGRPEFYLAARVQKREEKAPVREHWVWGTESPHPGGTPF